MIYEYAMEPELLALCTDRISGQLLRNSLGAGNPRILSRYPERWKICVDEAFKAIKNAVPKDDEKLQAKLQLQETRLTQLVQDLSGKMVKRQNVSWDESKAWIENAQNEHGRTNFHALICRENPASLPYLIGQESLESGGHARWTVPRQKDVTSTPVAMGSELASLLKISREIIFIDPYFRANRPKWTRVFEALFQHIANGLIPLNSRDIKLYASRDVERAPSADFFKDECKRHLRRILPRGMKISVRRLSKHIGGEDLHHRYILTDIGGVKLDPGFDERDRGAHTEFMLLEKEMYALRWYQYTGNPPAFDQSEAPFEVFG